MVQFSGFLTAANSDDIVISVHPWGQNIEFDDWASWVNDRRVWI